jgi:hypothetical protein
MAFLLSFFLARNLSYITMIVFFMFGASCYRYVACNPESGHALLNHYGEFIGVQARKPVHVESTLHHDDHAVEYDMQDDSNDWRREFLRNNPAYYTAKYMHRAMDPNSHTDSSEDTRHPLTKRTEETALARESSGVASTTSKFTNHDDQTFSLYCPDIGLRGTPEDIEQLMRWPVWHITLVSSIHTLEDILTYIGHVGNFLIGLLNFLSRLVNVK